MSKIYKILIIDDLEDIHDAIKKTLKEKESVSGITDLFGDEKVDIDKKEWNFLIESEFQGENGFKNLKEKLERNDSYDLIVCDMRMPPGWDGLETMKRIAELDSTSKIILCTAFSDHSIEKVRNEVGTQKNIRLLEKPFSMIDLKEIVKKVLS